MALILRETKGSPLTIAEMDGNLTYLETTANSGGYTETIVNISSAQILAMGTTPISLLPAPGANKSYYIDKVILEYTHNTTPYTTGFGEFLKLATTSYGNGWEIDPYFIGETQNMVAFIGGNPTYPSTKVPTIGYQPLNESIYFKMYGANPTSGDGTLRIKIYHKTITFGV